MPRRYEIIPEDLTCGMCGKKFQGRSSQRYCTPQCKKKAYYQNNQEKLLEDRRHREVITALIEQHHGRVVDSPGDNMLAEFANAVDAVKSAVAIQSDRYTQQAGFVEAERRLAEGELQHHRPRPGPCHFHRLRHVAPQ